MRSYTSQFNPSVALPPHLDPLSANVLIFAALVPLEGIWVMRGFRVKWFKFQASPLTRPITLGQSG